MRSIAFDIETEPNQDKVEELDAMPVKPNGRLKDPTKIEQHAEERRSKRRERAALSPFFGRVISWHVAMDGVDGKVRCVSEFREPSLVIDPPLGGETTRHVHNATDADGAERKLIQSLVEFLERHDGDQVVTYYGAAFDIPFLQRRSFILGGTFPAIETGKYKVANPFGAHLDVYAYLTDYRDDPLGLPQKLANYAHWLLGEEPPFDDHEHKTKYAEWFREGNLEPLRIAGEWDALMTYKLGAACRILGGDKS